MSTSFSKGELEDREQSSGVEMSYKWELFYHALAPLFLQWFLVMALENQIALKYCVYIYEQNCVELLDLCFPLQREIVL